MSSKQRRLIRNLLDRWTGRAKKEKASRIVPVAAADRGRKRIPMGYMKRSAPPQKMGPTGDVEP